MAKSQCSLAVVSCSMCLSTSATERLQLLFFLPQTTLSSPVRTLCSSEFRSLQLSERGGGQNPLTSKWAMHAFGFFYLKRLIWEQWENNGTPKVSITQPHPTGCYPRLAANTNPLLKSFRLWPLSKYLNHPEFSCLLIKATTWSFASKSIVPHKRL